MGGGEANMIEVDIAFPLWTTSLAVLILANPLVDLAESTLPDERAWDHVILPSRLDFV